MKLNVYPDRFFRIAGLCGHIPFLQQRLHFLDVFFRAVQGGFFRSLHFQELPYFVQVPGVSPPETLGERLGNPILYLDKSTEPCRTLSDPVFARIRIASRMVDRPTPNCSINSGSEGSFWPAWYSPRESCCCNLLTTASARL